MMELGKKVLVVGWENLAWLRHCFCVVGAAGHVSDIRSAEALANDIPALLDEVNARRAATAC